MSKIWFFMMLSSIVIMVFSCPSQILPSMIEASESTVSLCVNFIAIYSVWLGLLEILDKCGLSKKLSKLLSPLIKKLFKSSNEEANKYISINLSSNILGLGNASTPSGIKAMELLDDKTGKANFSMIMLLVINCASISLLPTTTIGLRQTAGSTNATSIIIPTILTSISCLIVAIMLVFICNKIHNAILKKHSAKNN